MPSLLSCLALCCAAYTPEEWASLPMPSLCLPPPGVQALARRVDAAHIRWPGMEPEQGASKGSTELTRLPVGILTRQLEEAARAANGKLSVQQSGPELFVEGDAAGINAARAWLADLEQQTSNLMIDLRVVLNTGEDKPRIDESARVLPGDWVAFGSRGRSDCLGDFDVEVAQDSGAADPVLLQLVEGLMLEVSARHLESSGEIVLVGALDSATSEAREEFDPATLDLGRVELPRVRVLTLCFADTIQSGAKLELTLQAPGAKAPWKLSIEARRASQDRGTGNTGSSTPANGWQMLDLSAFSVPAQVLPPIAPGGGFEEDLERNLARPRETHVEAGAIASWLARDSSSGSGSIFSKSAPSSQLLFTDSLLFVPRSDAAAQSRARSLLGALESSRRRGGRVRIQQGDLKAEFPVLACEPARLRSGTERSTLRDYDIEIAGQTWMPDPKVEAVFDGLVVDALTRDSTGAQLLAIHTQGQPVRMLPRESAWLGAVQANQRSIRARHWLQGSEPQVQFDGAARLEAGFLPR